jgi:hypothetical protein
MALARVDRFMAEKITATAGVGGLISVTFPHAFANELTSIQVTPGIGHILLLIDYPNSDKTKLGLIRADLLAVSTTFEYLVGGW